MRKHKKVQAVSLTSLLDLLFVMVFVALLQSKHAEVIKEVKKAKPKPVPVVVKPTIIKPTKPIPPTPIKPTMVSAIFEFSAPPSNPSVPYGSFLMSGKYDPKTRKINLGGVEWIERPQHFEMISLNGEYDTSLDVIRGTIPASDCQKFILRKKSASTTTGLSVLGVWEGTYDCSQGETKLKLTIK